MARATSPATAARPDAEPLEDVAARAAAAFVDIAATVPGGEVLVVTHAGLLRTLRRALGAEPAPLPNLGGNWFVVDGARSRSATSSS